jgi:uncharacterized circularly permuted ATP-grasp superfamily protein/uncharacterized alpha-E superfamily protein
LTETFAHYPFDSGRFDELFEVPGCPRSHWEGLFDELAATTADDIRERQAAAERSLRESGVSYNVYADPKGVDRPWELDVLPLVIASPEWRRIEAGIAQRAELLNRILADLYGAQTLLKSGSIPASLVFGQSGFLPAAHGMKVPGGVFLHVYAADLARSPDGRWWVMADRTQAPSGAGYALENRLVVARTFPHLYRDLHVQHLAQFFATLRDSLQNLAPDGDGQKLTVLLTAGPFNETYFEHTLLARYLGFPLVEGADLTVREGKVWLKTLGGLKRVHAILRRQDDGYCDPLELRSDSALGVAGLLDCARRGSVLIANAIGSGLLESHALLGFLPHLCERLLGESLSLPSVATWWCGEGAALDDALQHADRVVFKSADPAHSFDPIFGHDLDVNGLAELKPRLAAWPERIVAQELVHISQAPVLDPNLPGHITARGVGLRVFAVHSPAGYVVMPGGLTRVASRRDVRMLAMQRGGGSKDTWVLSEAPVDPTFTLLRETIRSADLVRLRAGIPSRIAENLFWFGRYQERCDDVARLLREALDQELQQGDNEHNAIVPVLALAEALELLDPADESEAALLAAATREDNAVGLPANLHNLERIAFALRDRISADHLRTLNQLLRDGAIGRTTSLQEALAWLDHTITNMTTLSGFALDGMTRDDGWRFLSIGRRLERLVFQCLAIHTALSHGIDANLSWLLRISDSIVTYRSRYLARSEWLPVLDLLVLDATNPRSLAFQAHGLAGYTGKLAQQYGTFAIDAFAEAAATLQALTAEELQSDRGRVRQVIATLRVQALVLSDRLTQRFFNHAQSAALMTFGI